METHDLLPIRGCGEGRLRHEEAPHGTPHRAEDRRGICAEGVHNAAALRRKRGIGRVGPQRPETAKRSSRLQQTLRSGRCAHEAKRILGDE
eukprot:CAMPEP_0117508854 /NCGR_PEP_ID=MMETSP0784-20121206/27168_1 /TAXON_ID=39447 /ORGANISM="" /LENGTH=90 /DNA_ID=CAMNT_0005304431 /DNA_START=439 /DNA_END=711 /DNA_ORIENTATION=+